jgi:hypothetical protein
MSLVTSAYDVSVHYTHLVSCSNVLVGLEGADNTRCKGSRASDYDRRFMGVYDAGGVS